MKNDTSLFSIYAVIRSMFLPLLLAVGVLSGRLLDMKWAEHDACDLILLFIAGIVFAANISVFLAMRKMDIWCKETVEQQGDIEQFPALPPVSYNFTRYIHYRNRMLHALKREDELKKIETSKYLALQSQINPHFIYNTLDIIRGKALMGEAESVSDMLEAMGSFLRYTISNMDKLVTISDELELISQYLFLQKIHYEDSLILTVENKGDANTPQCLIPKMTLQPIVENAIRHGFPASKSECRIRIIIEPMEDNLLYIHVLNNGIGMTAEQLRKLNADIKLDNSLEEKSKHGIGLKNVAVRIRLLYGSQYGLTVYSDEQNGTEVVVRIPSLPRGQYYEKRTIES